MEGFEAVWQGGNTQFLKLPTITPHLYMDGLFEKVDFHCHVSLPEGMESTLKFPLRRHEDGKRTQRSDGLFLFFSVVFLDVSSWNTFVVSSFFLEQTKHNWLRNVANTS